MTTLNHYPETANRAELCRLFGFGRTSWATFAASPVFPQPIGYAARWPLYRVAEVARWLYDNKPRILLKTPTGCGFYESFALLKSFNRLISRAEFAALLEMDDAGLMEFVEDNDAYANVYTDGKPSHWNYQAALEWAVEHFEILASMASLYRKCGHDVPNIIKARCKQYQEKADALRTKAEQPGFIITLSNNDSPLPVINE